MISALDSSSTVPQNGALSKMSMAVGEKSWDVLIQFLIEAVVLSILGGLMGIFLGIVGSYLFSATSRMACLD